MYFTGSSLKLLPVVCASGAGRVMIAEALIMARCLSGLSKHKDYAKDGKILIIIHIKEGYDKPYFDNQGAIWIKSGANKRKVATKEELRRLFQSSDLLHADEVPIRNSTINDIDKQYFDDFIRRNNFIISGDIPFKNILNNMNLVSENQLNLAGLLLFGENVPRFKPQFCIKAVYFSGNSMTVQKYRDSEEISGKLQQQYSLAYGFIKRNLKKLQGTKSINSTGELEIPEIVFEELLVNAIIHRNYFIDAPIKIFIFENRIEIISPGTLPNKLTVENIKSGNSNIRNPIICSFASKILPYRGIGTGIPRV